MRGLKRFLLVGLVPALALVATSARTEWRGVDLSYVNELEDCGVVYREGSEAADPYLMLAGAGANLVRLRLWVSPDWTVYGTLADVTRSMRRARAAGLQVMLTLHYSDDWAHPGKQLRPAAWPPADDVASLAQQLHDYTTATLQALEASVGLPEIVAVGNEINTNILVDEEVPEESVIDWSRNARLLNAGIEAVRSVSEASGKATIVMLHIAQPEHVEPWVSDALASGVTDFDVIGISYYPKWSQLPLVALEPALEALMARFKRRIAVVETAYPWSLEGRDEANNLLGEDSLLPGYAATAEGQAAYLQALRAAVRNAGGEGVVYWEPAWVTSRCETRWGRGSHWENATLFDFENRLLPGAAALLGPRE